MTRTWTMSSDDDELGFDDNVEVVVASEPATPVVDPLNPVEEEKEVVLPPTIDSEEQFVDLFGEQIVEEGEEDSITTTPKEEAVASKSIDAAYLKAKALYKAEKYGIEIDEDQEFDDESYAAFEDKLDQIRLEQKYNEARQANPLVDALLEVSEQGGDISDLLALFEQSKELTDIDTSTIQGKVEMIRKYYKDVENKPDAWVEKQLRRLSTGEDTKELEEEFSFIKEEYDSYFNEEKERQVQMAQQQKASKEAAIKKQVTSFEASLESKKLPKDVINKMSDFVYDDKKVKFKNSNETISLMDFAILKFKNDPEKLPDLVMFLQDQKAYNEKILIEAKNTTNDKIFRKKIETAVTTPASSTQQVKPVKPKFQFIT